MANLLDQIIGGIRSGAEAFARPFAQHPLEMFMLGTAIANPSARQRIPELLTLINQMRLQEQLAPLMVANAQLELLQRRQQLEQQQLVQHALSQMMDWDGSIDSSALATMARVAMLQGKPEAAAKLFALARAESGGALDKRLVAEYGDKRVYAVRDLGDPTKWHYITLSNPGAAEAAKLNARLRLMQQLGIVPPTTAAPAAPAATAPAPAAPAAPAAPDTGAAAPAAPAPDTGTGAANDWYQRAVVGSMLFGSTPPMPPGMVAQMEESKARAKKTGSGLGEIDTESRSKLIKWEGALRRVLELVNKLRTSAETYKYTGSSLAAARGKLLAWLYGGDAAAFQNRIQQLQDLLTVLGRAEFMVRQGAITEREQDTLRRAIANLDPKASNFLENLMEIARMTVEMDLRHHYVADVPPPEWLLRAARIYGVNPDEIRQQARAVTQNG